MTRIYPWQRHSAIVVVVCVGLAALWDVLFWGHPVGISVAIFAAALGIALLSRAPGLWKSAQGRILTLLAVLAVMALVEEPSILAVTMICLTGMALVLVAQRDLSLLRDNVSAWLVRGFMLIVSLGLRLVFDNVIVARWLTRHPRLGKRMMQVATFIAWWVLPLAAGGLFALLFSMANPVIAQWFSHVWDYLNEWLEWLIRLSLLRMFLWFVVLIITYGVLRYRHIWRVQRMEAPPVARPGSLAWLTGPQMIVRLLLVLNLIFAVENVLDIAYLYCGAPLPEGMTYKQYAHRGAYTLIATALLAGIFTLISFRHGGTAHRSRVCRQLVYLWIVQNIMLLVSTIWRVCVYVQATELTRLRVSTMIWCGIVAAGFLWIILRIMQHRTNAWLWRVNALTALGVLFVCGFINFDGLIADFNVRHCAQAGGSGTRLDTEYLEQLGLPALPAVAWYREHTTLAYDDRVRIDAVDAHLHDQMLTELSDWRGWTFRRWREAPPELRAAAGRTDKLATNEHE